MSIRTVLTLLREAIDSKLPAEQQGKKTIEQMTAAVHSIETGGGSMEIYKCVDAEGMTWIVVSGAGSPEANGYYYRGDDVWSSNMGGYYAQYYQKDGSCILDYGSSNQWQLKSGSTVLYADESWSYYDGDPSQCTNWVVRSGVSPVPTVTKETTTGNGWKGKLYDPETQIIADTITELEYRYKPPKIGKYYTEDSLIECDVFSGYGILFYHPLTSLHANGSVVGTVSNEIVSGIPCTLFGTQDSYIFDSVKDAQSTAISFSVWVYLDDNAGTNCGDYPRVFSFGTNTTENSNKRIDLTFGKSEQRYCFQIYENPVWINTWCDIIRNAWHHIVCVIDNGSIRLYLNGVLQESNTTSQLTFPTTSTIYINRSGQSKGIDGIRMAQFRIYDRVLTQEEIAAEADRCLAMVTEG